MTAPIPDEHPVFPFLTRARRRWLYNVTSTLSPLLAAYGVVQDSTAALIVSVATAVLGTGTARAHTPKETR